MANFSRVKPLGWSLFEILASALMNALDIDHQKSVNGDDGGTWAGPVNFTNASLTGTSSINTSGVVTTTSTVTGNQVVSTNDVTAGGDLLASSAAKAPIALFDKYQPRTTSSQVIDNATTAAVTCSLVTADTHYVQIDDTGGGAISAVLGSLALTTATGDADFEVKKGAKFRIHFTTGMPAGLEVKTNMSWPASMKFRSESDKYLMIGGTADVTIYELEQIGTPGAPIFDVAVRRVKKA